MILTSAPNYIKDFLDLPGDSCQSGLTLTAVLNGDSGQSGLTLQLFPMETIVSSNMIGQNNPINQLKRFIQLGAACLPLAVHFKKKCLK